MKFVYQYKVGDRVVYTGMGWKEPEYIDRGETGTVVQLYPGSVGVWWDKRDNERHSCDGKCPRGHGWYVYREEVMPKI